MEGPGRPAAGAEVPEVSPALQACPAGARPALKAITIIGGGLAGLTLGIALRRHSVPVVVWELGHYPRHRVCGEFISGRGQSVLERMGLLPDLIRAGAQVANTAAFFSRRQSFPCKTLPQSALCVSRFKLDALLAKKFQALGGELRCGARWRESDLEEGLVRANGRRAHRDAGGWTWFGLKAHALNVTAVADLELHFGTNGYVGLCRLAGGLTNVCGLFRRQKGPGDPVGNIQAHLRGEPDSPLAQRLDRAVFDPASICGVAALGLDPRRAAALEDCCIGDALTLIPPLTGNGMSMAFESAELATPALLGYARGESGWSTARMALARACDQAFGRRLRWAKRLQQVLLSAPGQKYLLPLAWDVDLCWKLLFRATR